MKKCCQHEGASGKPQSNEPIEHQGGCDCCHGKDDDATCEKHTENIADKGAPDKKDSTYKVEKRKGCCGRA